VTGDVLRLYNQARRDRGLPPAPSVTAPLRELQFSRKEQDWVPARDNRSGPNRGKAIIKPHRKVEMWRKELGEKPAAMQGASGAKGATTGREDGTAGTRGTPTLDDRPRARDEPEEPVG